MIYKHHDIKVYEGVEAQLHAFVTLALDGEESNSLSRPCYLRELWPKLGAFRAKPGSCGKNEWMGFSRDSSPDSSVV